MRAALAQTTALINVVQLQRRPSRVKTDAPLRLADVCSGQGRTRQNSKSAGRKTSDVLLWRASAGRHQRTRRRACHHRCAATSAPAIGRFANARQDLIRKRCADAMTSRRSVFNRYVSQRTSHKPARRVRLIRLALRHQANRRRSIAKIPARKHLTDARRMREAMRRSNRAAIRRMATAATNAWS